VAARVRIPLGLPIDGLVFIGDKNYNPSDLVESISLGGVGLAGSCRSTGASVRLA
jgi:hypothetical protein